MTSVPLYNYYYYYYYHYQLYIIILQFTIIYIRITIVHDMLYIYYVYRHLPIIAPSPIDSAIFVRLK